METGKRDRKIKEENPFREKEEAKPFSIIDQNFFLQNLTFYNLNAVTFCQKARSGGHSYKIVFL